MPADAHAPLPLPALPPRAADTHKGSYGTVLVIAGSRRYPGAAILAALGASRAGAGLVQLALADGLVEAVLPAAPFATVLRCAATNDGGLAAAARDDLLAAAARVSAVVLGPGLGTHADTGALLAALLPAIAQPLVLDADALNLVAAHRAGEPGDPHAASRGSRLGGLPLLRARAAQATPAPTVLTPHPGEFARLAAAAGWAPDAGAPSGPAARLQAATRFAREQSVVLVLKGHGTVVTDGVRARVETAGGPALAKGGMGDVLAGALGALLGQVPARLPDAAGAAALAVHAHARAGDLAAEELGPEAVLPEDVARLLGRALALRD